MKTNVTPIMGRPFVWLVDSRSEEGVQHTVSWLGDSLDSGPTCSCRAWAMRNRAHFAQHGKNYLCPHLILAKDKAWDEMVEEIKTQLLAQ